MDPAAAPAADATTGSTAAAASASLADLVRDSSEYAHALGQLVASEAELAKVNFTRLLIVALLVPAIAGGGVLAIDALFAALLDHWLHDWVVAIATVATINLSLLGTALWLLRSWWRSLSLPRSRAALASLWEHP